MSLPIACSVRSLQHGLPSSPRQRRVRMHPETRLHTCRPDGPACAPGPANTPASMQQSVRGKPRLRSHKLTRFSRRDH
jgi:hypothetical protein